VTISSARSSRRASHAGSAVHRRRTVAISRLSRDAKDDPALTRELIKGFSAIESQTQVQQLFSIFCKMSTRGTLFILDGVPPGRRRNKLAEPDAIKAWILSTMPRALAFARSLVRDQDIAEDVVHDCYCRLLQKASVYDLPESGLKILFRAITNAAVDYQGRQRVLQSLDVEVEDPRYEEPLTGAMTRELEHALETGLDLLPLAQRAALQMKSMGHSLQEIAETLTISVSNAGVLIHRARQSLARHLAPFLQETKE
jgi:RNA polymerase sigma factor (sigma-70 family)